MKLIGHKTIEDMCDKMRKYHLLLCIAVLFCGCIGANQPTQPQQAKALTPNDLASFNVGWLEVKKEFVCSNDYCKQIDCDRTKNDANNMVKISGKIDVPATCHTIVDNKRNDPDFESNYLEGDATAKISLRSKTDPDKSCWWDDHTVTLCCYARDDTNKKEACVTKPLKRLC
jgi:hypothetical protein